ncbi:c-type cytochrome [Legionella dresdenensis]|uniref:C-type cytochrome n=1 Tax=Legionella dresdenensis TaxID=450200 RepID=A0ABV8CC74_9GAMM
MYQYTAFCLALLYCITSWGASHHPQQFLNSIRGQKNEGQLIFKEFCAACHAIKPDIELNAPKIGLAKDWLPRLEQGTGLLLQHTVDGYGAMPARGGCFECTDEQLMLAIESMLPKIEKPTSEHKESLKNT